jgi:hypothetical protein
MTAQAAGPSRRFWSDVPPASEIRRSCFRRDAPPGHRRPCRAVARVACRLLDPWSFSQPNGPAGHPVEVHRGDWTRGAWEAVEPLSSWSLSPHHPREAVTAHPDRGTRGDAGSAMGKRARGRPSVPWQWPITDKSSPTKSRVGAAASTVATVTRSTRVTTTDDAGYPEDGGGESSDASEDQADPTRPGLRRHPPPEVPGAATRPARVRRGQGRDRV